MTVKLELKTWAKMLIIAATLVAIGLAKLGLVGRDEAEDWAVTFAETVMNDWGGLKA